MKRRIFRHIVSIAIASTGAVTAASLPTLTPTPAVPQTSAVFLDGPGQEEHAEAKGGRIAVKDKTENFAKCVRGEKIKNQTDAFLPSPRKSGTASPSPSPAKEDKTKGHSAAAATPAPSTSPASSAAPSVETPPPAESKTTSPGRSSIDITLTKFEPMQGSPGEPNYRNAQLSYRITASGSAKLDFPSSISPSNPPRKNFGATRRAGCGHSRS